MTYKIEQIEGIGPSYGQRLEAAGVVTSDDLLTRCATPAGRQKLAQVTGLSPDQILTWANQADLMRVSGVGSEFGQLLEASGANRNPENLVSMMARVNDEKKLTRVLPALKTVEKWVEQAQTMEPVLSH